MFKSRSAVNLGNNYWSAAWEGFEELWVRRALLFCSVESWMDQQCVTEFT